jgi:hypothetical protein
MPNNFFNKYLDINLTTFSFTLILRSDYFKILFDILRETSDCEIMLTSVFSTMYFPITIINYWPNFNSPLCIFLL